MTSDNSGSPVDEIGTVDPMRRRYVNEFFNARSMLTPGVAGATTMMITSSLVAAFGLPGSYVALAVSLLLGLVAMSDQSVRLPQRVIFYVLNSLIIFSMAYGLNAAGVEAFYSTERYVPAAGEIGGFFQPWPLGK